MDRAIIKNVAIHAIGWMLSTDCFHTVIGIGALGGIWYGLNETCGRPVAIGAVSAVMLAGIVYARTRK